MTKKSVEFRRATAADLEAIIGLLTDDILGQGREGGVEDLPHYQRAFEDIDRDPNQFLCVAETDGAIIGTLQLTFIPGLARKAVKRGQIEAVRIASDRRSEGLGEQLFQWAIKKCREEGCGLVQLTTDKARPDAHRFYDKLGFEPSHIGYKLAL